MASELLVPVLDILVIVALGATGVQVMKLAKQVKTLRQGRAEMDRHLAALGEAAARAEMALASLRKAAGDSGRQLEGQVNEARELIEELRFMAETADRIAARLEKGNAPARNEDSRPSAAAAPTSAPVSTAQAAETEKGSLKSMENRIRDRARDYLEKLSAGLAPASVGSAPSPSVQGLKSKAERELAEAMQARRAS